MEIHNFMENCPKCNGKDFIGIFKDGMLIKLSCLDCDYEKVAE